MLTGRLCSHLGPGPEVPHVLQFGLVEHPAVAELLQAHIFCLSGIAGRTLLEQQLELLVAPAHCGPQSLQGDTAEASEKWTRTGRRHAV